MKNPRDTRLKKWAELEILPKDYLFLLEEMISWLKNVWEGKTPSAKPKLCQFMENNCASCINYIGIPKPCYEIAWDPKSKSIAKENGWKILEITGKYDKKHLPNTNKHTHKLVYEGLIKYYSTLAKSIKRNHIENLIEVKISNNEVLYKEKPKGGDTLDMLFKYKKHAKRNPDLEYPEDPEDPEDAEYIEDE